MKISFKLLGATALLALAVACTPAVTNQALEDARQTDRVMKQVAVTQPVPSFEWSLERHLVIQLYEQRNVTAVTHSVWRGDLGNIEGDCPTIGFGIPYDTSLTNPLVAHWAGSSSGKAGVAIEQPEPNSIYASKNTNATWVNCVGTGGLIEPIYTEARVTSYPYPVEVDYVNNRVSKAGEATVTLNPAR